MNFWLKNLYSFKNLNKMRNYYEKRECSNLYRKFLSYYVFSVLIWGIVQLACRLFYAERHFEMMKKKKIRNADKIYGWYWTILILVFEKTVQCLFVILNQVYNVLVLNIVKDASSRLIKEIILQFLWIVFLSLFLFSSELKVFLFWYIFDCLL